MALEASIVGLETTGVVIEKGLRDRVLVPQHSSSAGVQKVDFVMNAIETRCSITGRIDASRWMSVNERLDRWVDFVMGCGPPWSRDLGYPLIPLLVSCRVAWSGSRGCIVGSRREDRGSSGVETVSDESRKCRVRGDMIERAIQRHSRVRKR